MRIYVIALLAVTWFTACGLDPADTRATTKKDASDAIPQHTTTTKTIENSGGSANATPPTSPATPIGDSNDLTGIQETGSTAVGKKISLGSTINIADTKGVTVGNKAYFVGVNQDFYALDLVNYSWVKSTNGLPPQSGASYVNAHPNYLSVTFYRSKTDVAVPYEEFAIYDLKTNTWFLTSGSGAPLRELPLYLNPLCRPIDDTIVCPPATRSGSFDPFLYTYSIATKSWSKHVRPVSSIDPTVHWSGFSVLQKRFYSISNKPKGYALNVAKNEQQEFNHDSQYYLDKIGSAWGFGFSGESRFSTGNVSSQLRWTKLGTGEEKTGTIERRNNQSNPVAVNWTDHTSVVCGDKLYIVGGYGFVSAEPNKTQQPSHPFVMSFSPVTEKYSVAVLSGVGPSWSNPNVLCVSDGKLLSWGGVEAWSCSSSGSDCSGKHTNAIYELNFP